MATGLSSALSDFHFLRPLWLWALLALPLLAWSWRARRRRDSVWRDVVDPHLLPHLLDMRSGVKGMAASLLLALCGVALAVLALAGPTWRKVDQPLLQGQAPLVIALDLSSAVLANDLPPSRLLQARAKIDALLKQRAGGQVGLVAYADDAFTVAPLTDDAANVALFLDALAPDVMPVDGSRGERAIEWSTKLLKQAGFERGDILLLTDHASSAARYAATAAAREGFRVSALGLGSEQGASYQKADGAIAHTRLDAASLRTLAAAGNGEYRALTPDLRDVTSLGVLKSQATDAAATRGQKTSVWQDAGYWLLLPLMLLALLAFRRGGALAALLLCAWLPWQPLQAAERAAGSGGLWQRADQLEHERMQDGGEAYRKGDFAAAESAWQGIDNADAAYNKGNALAKTGRYEDAIAAYDDALRLQRGMADAIANKQAVEAAMKRKPPPGPKQGSRGQQQQKPKQGQPKPGDGEPSNAADGQPQDDGKSTDSQNGKPDTSRAGQKQEQPGQSGAPASADAEAQRKADAAQRARMQRAVEQGRQQAQDGQKIEGKPERAESAAEREKRQANEAWLRRVPDDPGGLLRAKFRLEHERRAESGGL
ncbi:MAG: VWA domain-containing protein [Luteimonas sp.]|nr:VWA domain-containing protein [Luteimonas sp.]